MSKFLNATARADRVDLGYGAMFGYESAKAACLGMAECRVIECGQGKGRHVGHRTRAES